MQNCLVLRAIAADYRCLAKIGYLLYKVTLWRVHDEEDSLDGLGGVIQECEVEGEIRHAFKSNHAKKGQLLFHYTLVVLPASHSVIQS